MTFEHLVSAVALGAYERNQMDLEHYAGGGKPVNDKALMDGLLKLEGKIALAVAEEEAAKKAHKDAKDNLEQLQETTHALLRARKKKQKVYQLDDGSLTLSAPDRQTSLPLLGDKGGKPAAAKKKKAASKKWKKVPRKKATKKAAGKKTKTRGRRP